MAKQREYAVTPGDEAARLAAVVDEIMQKPLLPSLSPADLIALGQLHALLHLAERVDELTRAVKGDGR